MSRPEIFSHAALAGPRKWRWLLALTMLAVLVLSLLPQNVPMPSTGWDKSNHLLAFATLGGLGCRSWPGRLRFVLPALLAYGGLIEVLQSFTPDRSAEFEDLLADAIGLLIGAAIAAFLASRLRRARGARDADRGPQKNTRRSG